VIKRWGCRREGKIRCFVLLIWDELEGEDLDAVLVEVEGWKEGCEGRRGGGVQTVD
jgi:hypothetical protein